MTHTPGCHFADPNPHYGGCTCRSPHLLKLVFEMRMFARTVNDDAAFIHYFALRLGRFGDVERRSLFGALVDGTQVPGRERYAIVGPADAKGWHETTTVGFYRKAQGDVVTRDPKVVDLLSEIFGS